MKQVSVRLDCLISHAKGAIKRTSLGWFFLVAMIEHLLF